MSWGLRPESMIGYSICEYVAACLAGVVSLEDALYMVAKRAEIIQRLPSGEMLAVPLSEQELLPLLRDGVSISAVNTPSFSIVSGTQERVRELADRLTEQGTICR